MVNSLTRQVGFKLGPIVLDTLVKHYFERVSKAQDAEHIPKLRKEELLYDEAFNIIKMFMEASTKHTVEELQAFSNTRTPSPPWVHVVRLLVPMSCCDEAADLVIKALGGEEVVKRVVGGIKWWQVRGVKGVDAEWIVAKKDWQEAKKRHKARTSTDPSTSIAPEPSSDPKQELPPTYQPEMDDMRCILYAHGGGYYFGSIDQERYAIQRLARKINGRVFTINYRLAPQYPFPCAVQDMIAAYLYLIRPPPGALHTPVSPSRIVFSGDSAGGGLCIAALQVIRDSGLPAPAGAVLISPWCDLTHSFPSIHLNTATDIIPTYGLSFHKPSTLWPPPPDDVTAKVHEGLRSRIRQAVSRPKTKPKKSDMSAHIAHMLPHQGQDQLDVRSPSPALSDTHSIPAAGGTLRLGSTASLPAGTSTVKSQRMDMKTAEGAVLTVERQIHMYTPNYMLKHPLVSHVLSYLGGLPPLLVIAGDKEVLRDEIVYFAHKAANPEKYPVGAEQKELNPVLQGIEQRYGPTKVHLQVYDDSAHTLPILFAFTTPAKYCFRAMATFIKHVTEPSIPPAPIIPEQPIIMSPFSTQLSLVSSSPEANPELRRGQSLQTVATQTSGNLRANGDANANGDHPTPLPSPALSGKFSIAEKGDEETRSRRRSSIRRVVSASVTGARRAGSVLRSGRRPATATGDAPSKDPSSDVAGPRFNGKASGHDEVLYAGEAAVYANGLDTMIRERVSTRGVIRPLEPQNELPAFKLPPELIGEISELAVRRFIDGIERFGRKFAKTEKAIEKARQKNIARAAHETKRNMAQLQAFLSEEGSPDGSKDALPASKSWGWAWAMDTDENPPASSIVSRRDTEEARRLARIADQAVLMDHDALSGNNLWSLIVNFLTVTPERHTGRHHGPHDAADGENDADQGGRERFRTKIARVFEGKSHGSSVKVE